MSSLAMPIIACMARCAAAASLLLIISIRMVGTTCHDRP